MDRNTISIRDERRTIAEIDEGGEVPRTVLSPERYVTITYCVPDDDETRRAMHRAVAALLLDPSKR